MLWHLKESYDQVAEHITEVERLLQVWHQGDEFSQRSTTIPGVGWLTATVLSAVAGDRSAFRNGRQLAAYLGLALRRHSSGGKVQLLEISKRGDGYIRGLLVHGARAVLGWARRRQRAGRHDGFPWLDQLLARGHVNRVTVPWRIKLHGWYGPWGWPGQAIGRPVQCKVTGMRY